MNAENLDPAGLQAATQTLAHWDYVSATGEEPDDPDYAIPMHADAAARIVLAYLQAGGHDQAVREQALLDAADRVRDKDHRLDLGDEQHATGWRQALNEVEHELRMASDTPKAAQR